MARWTERLKARWGLKNTLQVVVVLLVFACTGTTVLLLKYPLFAWWFPDGQRPLWATVIYYVLILPVYNIFLLIYGAIFGQFTFFWSFEKRFFSRLFRKQKRPDGTGAGR
ncbi:MAG: hypothetical protein KatS3mg032_1688 [Cyclobacteriaceae bacterium]|nr:MAG: hypothetical protein KatS3mg032_1688 [Cyclobacteriaceae bacterium]